MTTPRAVVTIALLTVLLFTGRPAFSDGPTQNQEKPNHRKTWEQRWVRINANMLVDENARQANEICSEQIRRVRQLLEPDGYFLAHDEIRTGGWEPSRFKTTGELFAYNIKRCYEIAATEGGGKPVCVWSDM